jgi:outer membrane lipoprotein-sorting protein
MNKIFFFTLIFLLIFCFPKTEQIKEPVFSNNKINEQYKFNDPRSKNLLSLIEGIEKNSQSFQGEFSMKIKTGENLKDTNSLNGKIFFDKNSSKVKIQLMEPFFGLIISQIISDEETIQIKSSGKDKIHTQKMGDLFLADPATKKQIIIPFPVIYYSIVQNFTKNFQNQNSFFSPSENKVKLIKDQDDLTYTFYEKGLVSLELFSKVKNLKAKSEVPENFRTGDNPALRVITIVTDIYTSKDTNYVDIQYKNLKKNITIPESTFTFN